MIVAPAAAPVVAERVCAVWTPRCVNSAGSERWTGGERLAEQAVRPAKG